MATYQRRTASGAWVDEARIDQLIPRVLEREPWYAPRVNREPMTTAEQILGHLAAGHEINYGDDWYAAVRMTPQPVAATEAPRDMVRCSCGHVCERELVMSASMGTSCPDCYDRMSD